MSNNSTYQPNPTAPARPSSPVSVNPGRTRTLQGEVIPEIVLPVDEKPVDVEYDECIVGANIDEITGRDLVPRHLALTCGHCICSEDLSHLENDVCPACRRPLEGPLVTDEVLAGIYQRKSNAERDAELKADLIQKILLANPAVPTDTLYSMNLEELNAEYLRQTTTPSGPRYQPDYDTSEFKLSPPTRTEALLGALMALSGRTPSPPRELKLSPTTLAQIALIDRASETKAGELSPRTLRMIETMDSKPQVIIPSVHQAQSWEAKAMQESLMMTRGDRKISPPRIPVRVPPSVRSSISEPIAADSPILPSGTAVRPVPGSRLPPRITALPSTTEIKRVVPAPVIRPSSPRRSAPIPVPVVAAAPRKSIPIPAPITVVQQAPSSPRRSVPIPVPVVIAAPKRTVIPPPTPSRVTRPPIPIVNVPRRTVIPPPTVSVVTPATPVRRTILPPRPS